MKFAASRFLAHGFDGPLTEDRQLHLAHRALHAEQQPIVGMARIVDSILVYDERADQSTELDERMPVATIAGKTRRLDRKHGADTIVADRREQSLEARTSDAAARAAEVVVDDIDVAPAKLLGAIDGAELADDRRVEHARAIAAMGSPQSQNGVSRSARSMSATMRVLFVLVILGLLNIDTMRFVL